ncbi:MAG TPA: hypothetical protein DCM40_44880 [Maribacter sp.]|nr:hypothetical protein [Maribacter sp.]
MIKMKNNMKLIMESFRKNVLHENTQLAPAGAQMEDALEDIFDDVLQKLEDKVDNELNEELITIASILYTLWITVMGAAGMGSLLTKFSKYMLDAQTTQDTTGLEKVDKFFEGVFESVATLGSKPITKYIVKKVSDPADVAANLDKVDNIYKIAAVVIGLAVSGVELAKAADKAGGVSNYIADVFGKAGIKDAEALSATTEAFSTAVGTGADGFEILKFIRAARTAIGNYIRIATP